MSVTSRATHEVLTSAAGDALSEEVRNFLRKFGDTEAGRKLLDALGRKATKMFDSEDCRIDMLNFVFGPLQNRNSGRLTRNLKQHLADAMNDPLGDNRVVRILSLVFEKTREKKPDGTYVHPDPKDDHYLLEVFEEIGGYNGQEFREWIEHCDNDPVEQLLRWTGRQAKKSWDIASNWARIFIASTMLWLWLILHASVAKSSQTEMWVLALMPGIALFLLVMFKVNPLVLPVVNWLDDRLKTGIIRSATKAFALGIATALFLSYYPMPSNRMALLLAAAVGGIFFARRAKLAFASLVAWIALGFVVYGIFTGVDKTQPATVKATVSTAITEAKGLVGMGPGSSQSNAIILSSNPNDDPIQIPAGPALWFQIEPGGWSQWVSCQDKTHFNLIHRSSRVQVKCYIAPPGQPTQEEIYIAGPGERPTFPLYVTMISFNAPKTIWTKIGAVKNGSR